MIRLMPSELVEAPEPLGHRLELGQQPLEVGGDQLLVGLLVEDEDRVHAVARRAPLVLLREPRRQVRQRAARVELGREVLDQAVRERRDAQHLVQGRDAVAHAHLQRPELRRRPQVPADLVELVDDAGLEQVGGVAPRTPTTAGTGTAARPSAAAGTSAPGWTRSRCPRRPRTATTRSAPAGGRSTTASRALIGQDLVPVLDADVDVDAVDQHLPAPPLGPVDERLVARLVGHLLVVPARERMGARAHQLDPQRVGDLPDLVDRALQVGAGLARPCGRRSDTTSTVLSSSSCLIERVLARRRPGARRRAPSSPPGAGRRSRRRREPAPTRSRWWTAPRRRRGCARTSVTQRGGPRRPCARVCIGWPHARNEPDPRRSAAARRRRLTEPLRRRAGSLRRIDRTVRLDHDDPVQRDARRLDVRRPGRRRHRLDHPQRHPARPGRPTPTAASRCTTFRPRTSCGSRPTCRYSHSGEGLHRFVDPVDDRVYLYTQFEVPDARRVFTTFEQPDLKATFEFHVTAPADWSVTSNSPTPEPEPVRDGVAVWHFAPTKKMSTYITALVAGHYHRVTDVYSGAYGEIPLGVFCRQSLVEHLDADEIFTITKQGFEFFEGAFEMGYPFGKYDQLFVPEYNMGAMENAGCVTFRDELIFRSRQTIAAYEQRANTILHEMAHMWFGDLVTMKWWDDLWLNESFAEFAAHHSVDAGHPLHRRVDRLHEQPQELGLPPGPAAVDAPDRGRQLRPARGRGQLRRHHLRQGRLGAAAAGRLGRREGLLRRAAGLLHQARVRQHRADRPAGRAGGRVRPRAGRLGRGVAADVRRQHAARRLRRRRDGAFTRFAIEQTAHRGVTRRCAATASPSACTTGSRASSSAPSASRSTSAARRRRSPSWSTTRRPT